MKTVSKSSLAILSLLFALSVHGQVPAYSSYPSAQATMYLDFDGHYVEGTSWNYNGPISCAAAGLTNDQITEIFNRIAEDYRPFNVNITTDSTKYWSAPQFQRMRVIFTVTSSWYGAAGGVSYINSFSWGDNTPCFVFSALLNYKTKNVAEAASHEIGHTLGLNHQSSYDGNCTKTSEYNAGAGAGEIGWAPIMGVGYYRNLTLWHNGTNPWGCSAYQDDLSIITNSYNGFGYRTDDFSNDAKPNTPTTNFSNNRFAVNGVIEKITDKDVFKFTMPIQGLFHLDANPYSVGTDHNGSNLDLKVEILTNNQTVVGTYNPDQLLNATIDTVLQPGNYFLRVQSMGNVYAPEYATLGSYALEASLSPISALPVHRLELRGFNKNTRHQLDWAIEADETIVQQVLEVSANGRSFQPVSSFNSNERTYSYLPNVNGTAYYRLKVTFDNNKEYSSNIVTIPATNNKPSVVNNVARTEVQVNSPSSFSYAVVDFSGRQIAKGNLSQGINTISTARLSKGMYIIQYSNGEEQYAEKIMKQ
jgi:hypothetical protein